MLLMELHAKNRLHMQIPARLPRPPWTLVFRMGTTTITTIRVLRKRLGVRNVTLSQCFVTHSSIALFLGALL